MQQPCARRIRVTALAKLGNTWRSFPQLADSFCQSQSAANDTCVLFPYIETTFRDRPEGDLSVRYDAFPCSKMGRPLRQQTCWTVIGISAL
jgi:hypothetical protein